MHTDQPPTLPLIVIDRIEGTAVLRINRPDKRNALDSATRAQLLLAIDWAHASESVRVIVITGVGEKAFVAGADVSEFATRTVLEQRATMEGRRVFDALAQCPKPVIAMINGYCLGGGLELAMAADIRIAATEATLGQPEINLAIIPGGGGTQRLPRLVGLGAAMRMVLSGAGIDATEALRLGLVDEVVPRAALESRTLELCGQMAKHSPIAIRLAKEALRASMELPLDQGLARERELFCLAFSSADRVEGVSAFLAKRPPAFTGR